MAVLLVPSIAVTAAHAGGDAVKVRIRSFARQGEHGAQFSAVVASAEEQLPGGCKQLEVEARYAWWKWWWNDVGGQVSRRAQLQALKVLEDSAARGELVGFGYMGTGWDIPNASEPCRVVSHALVEWRDDPLPGTSTSVLSYFKAP
jgi:hypothetical protein